MKLLSHGELKFIAAGNNENNIFVYNQNLVTDYVISTSCALVTLYKSMRRNHMPMLKIPAAIFAAVSTPLKVYL